MGGKAGRRAGLCVCGGGVPLLQCCVLVSTPHPSPPTPSPPLLQCRALVFTSPPTPAAPHWCPCTHRTHTTPLPCIPPPHHTMRATPAVHPVCARSWQHHRPYVHPPSTCCTSSPSASLTAARALPVPHPLHPTPHPTPRLQVNPQLAAALIDERDQVMVDCLSKLQGRVVGVVGLAHLDGMERRWQEMQHLDASAVAHTGR